MEEPCLEIDCNLCCSLISPEDLTPRETEAINIELKKKGKKLEDIIKSRRCPFLKDGKCSIYGKRFKVCREFECNLYRMLKEIDKEKFRKAYDRFKSEIEGSDFFKKLVIGASLYIKKNGKIILSEKVKERYDLIVEMDVKDVDLEIIIKELSKALKVIYKEYKRMNENKTLLRGNLERVNKIESLDTFLITSLGRDLYLRETIKKVLEHAEKRMKDINEFITKKEEYLGRLKEFIPWYKKWHKKEEKIIEEAVKGIKKKLLKGKKEEDVYEIVKFLADVPLLHYLNFIGKRDKALSLVRALKYALGKIAPKENFKIIYRYDETNVGVKVYNFYEDMKENIKIEYIDMVLNERHVIEFYASKNFNT